MIEKTLRDQWRNASRQERLELFENLGENENDYWRRNLIIARELYVTSSISPKYSAKVARDITLMIEKEDVKSPDNPNVVYTHNTSEQILSNLFWLDSNYVSMLSDATHTEPEGAHDFEVSYQEIGFVSNEGMVIFEKSVPLRCGSMESDVNLQTYTTPVRSISWKRFGNKFIIIATVDVDLMSFPPYHQVVESLLYKGSDSPEMMNTVVVGSPFAFLLNFFLLLNTPTVTHVEKLQPNVKSGKKSRKKIDDMTEVNVVTLRPGSAVRYVYEDAAEHDGREYSHRWLVRGHWRNQRYPSLGENETRRIWIAPYIKGPDGMPILSKTKVTAVRSS